MARERRICNRIIWAYLHRLRLYSAGDESWERGALRLFARFPIPALPATPLTFSAVQIRAIPSARQKVSASPRSPLLTPTSFNLDEIRRRRERKRRATFAAHRARGSISEAAERVWRISSTERWKAASFRLHLIGSLWRQQPQACNISQTRALISTAMSHRLTFGAGVTPTHRSFIPLANVGSLI